MYSTPQHELYGQGDVIGHIRGTHTPTPRGYLSGKWGPWYSGAAAWYLYHAHPIEEVVTLRLRSKRLQV